MLASAGAVLAGCSNPIGPEPAPPVHTVDSLLSSNPFYIAHRGSMDNWPEHTVEAYAESISHGVKAIEVSVSSTDDSVFVCHHDLTTLRMTGTDLTIADVPYSALQPLQNDARRWLGPNSYLLPIPRLQEVLDAHAGSHVIFLEDKQQTNTQALLDLLDRIPNASEHVVWKQPAMSEQHRVAASRGYKTWGYFTNADSPTIDKGDARSIAESFDLLGIHSSASDDTIKKLVRLGKPVIGWEVHTRSMRDRLSALGVQGMMCSNVPYVMNDAPASAVDQFATGVRAAGDLPWALDWTHQPTIVPASSSLWMQHPEKASYCMGSMSPITAASYTIRFEMRWPEARPRKSEHAGIAFGQRQDTPYRVREPNAPGGYHLILRADGLLELFSRESNSVPGYSLGKVKTPVPIAAEWMQFEVEITLTQIHFSRVDGQRRSGTVTSSMHRGGYFSLCKNYYGPRAVEFRGVSVT